MNNNKDIFELLLRGSADGENICFDLSRHNRYTSDDFLFALLRYAQLKMIAAVFFFLFKQEVHNDRNSNFVSQIKKVAEVIM